MILKKILSRLNQLKNVINSVNKRLNFFLLLHNKKINILRNCFKK